MRSILVALLLLSPLGTETLRAQEAEEAPLHPTNLDFEDMSRESPPAGWYRGGTNPEKYVAKIDTVTVRTGSGSGLIAGEEMAGDDYGTMTMYFDATEYWAQRLRFSAWVKTEGVTGWVTLWMRIDGELEGQLLGFDNMEGRPPIGGTAEWTKYEIVLDVPPVDSRVIRLGAILEGPGKVWIDDVVLEDVGDDVETTNLLPEGGVTVEEQ